MGVTWRDIFQFCLFIIYTIVISRIAFVRGVREVHFDGERAFKLYYECLQKLPE
jgi:hypothetical protein